MAWGGGVILWHFLSIRWCIDWLNVPETNFASPWVQPYPALAEKKTTNAMKKEFASGKNQFGGFIEVVKKWKQLMTERE